MCSNIVLEPKVKLSKVVVDALGENFEQNAGCKEYRL